MNWMFPAVVPAMDRIDQMTEFAVAALLADGDGWRHVARDLAARWPDVPPLEIVFVLSTAAEAIGDLFMPEDSAGAPGRVAWRLAALVASDVYAMQRLGLACATAADMVAYWRDHDPYFLRL